MAHNVFPEDVIKVPDWLTLGEPTSSRKGFKGHGL